jgi:hypothetical protein
MSEDKKNKEDENINDNSFFGCDCAHCPNSCGSVLEEDKEDKEDK